ncbi:MAG: hypothetical protein WCX12_00385 [Candidatus Paceibacterota bacterium]|jgi:hypothetical protein
MYRVFSSILVALIIVISVSISAIAGNYPPANLKAVSIEDSIGVSIPIISVSIYQYSQEYRSQRSLDGQIVRGTVVIYGFENEIYRFDLYGGDSTKLPISYKNCYGFFNHAQIVYVDGAESEIVIHKAQEYGDGLYEGKNAAERICEIRIGKDDVEAQDQVCAFEPYVTTIK